MAMSVSYSLFGFFFFKQKTAYEMRISDWSSDVCSSDLTLEGRFDPDQFADKAAIEQVRMTEIKLSQGAKPGHGGLLPGAKVSAEIAATRCVPQGVDCLSPPGHSAFSTPIEQIGRAHV